MGSMELIRVQRKAPEKGTKILYWTEDGTQIVIARIRCEDTLSMMGRRAFGLYEKHLGFTKTVGKVRERFFN